MWPRICTDIFTKESERVPIHDVTWWDMVGGCCAGVPLILKGFVDSLGIWGLPEVSLYCAGFPCQPYSLLSSTRRMLADGNARQLFKVIKRIRRYRPKVTWFFLKRFPKLIHVTFPKYDENQQLR